MAYEEREGSGSLFKNDYKENENQPDWKGKIMIGGNLVKLSAWEKGYGSEGKIRMSLAVDTFEPKPKDGFAQAHQAIDDNAIQKDVPDPSVPF